MPHTHTLSTDATHWDSFTFRLSHNIARRQLPQCVDATDSVICLHYLKESVTRTLSCTLSIFDVKYTESFISQGKVVALIR